MTYDVASVRGLYPTLGSSVAQLEGPLGALQPETVIRAIITSLRSAPAQPGSRSTRSRRTSAAVNAARVAVADLVAADPGSVVFGPSQSVLMRHFTDVLASDWQLGDEIVVSRLDSDSDLRHLTGAARAIGVSVRWAEVDLESGELPTWQYERLVNRHTRVVTVALANPITGTIPDVRAIADRAHEVGALVVVNAGAIVPHLAIDLEELGADLLNLDLRGFGGPTLAAMIARPGLLGEFAGRGYDDRPARPEDHEDGPLPVELLDGVTAAVDHLAGLDPTATGSRRQRLTTSLIAAAQYQRALYLYLHEQLGLIRGVTILGGTADRTPVVAFTIHGHRPEQVADQLARQGVSVWTGPHGHTELCATFGADELGGPVLAGIMPHTTRSEVERLVGGVLRIIHGTPLDTQERWSIAGVG